MVAGLRDEFGFDLDKGSYLDLAVKGLEGLREDIMTSSMRLKFLVIMSKAAQPEPTLEPDPEPTRELPLPDMLRVLADGVAEKETA